MFLFRQTRKQIPRFDGTWSKSFGSTIGEGRKMKCIVCDDPTTNSAKSRLGELSICTDCLVGGPNENNRPAAHKS